MPWQQHVRICKSKTLHTIDDIMMLRNSQAVFPFKVDVRIVVHPLIMNIVVQLADVLPAPSKRKEILALMTQDRSRHSKPAR